MTKKILMSTMLLLVMCLGVHRWLLNNVCVLF